MRTKLNYWMKPDDWLQLISALYSIGNTQKHAALALHLSLE